MKALKTSIATALFLFSALVAAADNAAAQKVVEHLHETLLKAMTGGEKLGYAGRVELLAPVIDTSFDFESIARIVTGRYWKDVKDEQRQRFTDVFRALSTATYARNFSVFAGEKFEILGAEDNRGSLVVRTQLVKSDGGTVPLNYLLRQNNGEWRIVNVVAQGVSDLSLKRADYTAVIKAEGFDSLVDRLKKKVTEMSQGS